jgi:hypothetical protein
LSALKRFLKTLKRKFYVLDNERLAIGAAAILGLLLLLPLLIIVPDLFASSWLVDLLSILAVYSGFVAGGAYIGRLFNLITARPFKTAKNEKTKVTTVLNKEVVMGRRIGMQEKELTPTGMLFGAGLALIGILLHLAIPFFNVFSYFAYALIMLGYACTFGGLFNRLGSSMDNTRLPQEKKAILLGTACGFILALSCVIVCLATGTLPIVALSSISKVFFDLFILNKTFFTFTFILSVSSLAASIFDYFAKACCFFMYYYLGNPEKELIERLESRFHEYRGAFWGLAIGLLLAIGIVTCLALSGSLAVGPLTLGITSIFIVMSCNTAIPALFSRLGRVLDGMNRAAKPLDDPKKVEELPHTLHQREEATVSNDKSLPLPRCYSCPVLFFKKPNNNDELNSIESQNSFSCSLNI